MSASSQVLALAARMGAECKSLRTLLNGNLASLSALTTADKTSLVAALNEVRTLAASAGIDDAVIATGSTWSSQKTSDAIANAINALVDGAPTALDTLKELAAQLSADQTALGGILVALSNRVRFDEAQVLTAEQQAMALANIGGASAQSVADLAAAIGDTNADFVAAFNTSLV